MTKQRRARELASFILNGFDRHFAIFSEYNRKAAQHFYDGDWQAAKKDARIQVDLYDQRVQECLNSLRQQENLSHLDQTLWRAVKREYVNMLYEHLQPELAESYYNSVFCKLFNRNYYNNDYIFYHYAINTQNIQCQIPDYRSYYPAQENIADEFRRLLDEVPVSLPFADKERDIARMAAYFENAIIKKNTVCMHMQIHILTPVFYRNKGAYLVGRIINNANITPLIIPLLRDENGELYVDTMLTDASEVSHVFSFTRAYFKADFPVPSALIRFLQSILPTKSLADLYTAIGFHKQSKNEFYRAFLYHLRHSSDQLIVAPGEEGMVMMVFTLPSYPYVFKVIKDRFHPNKKVTHRQVKERYHLIKQLDRVGRMADMWEFSYVALPRARFTKALMTQLEKTCAESLSYEKDQLILKHVYIERRMVPLNLYIQDLDEEQTRRILRDYGKAIEEIAAAGIFPGDLLLKNFGVTRQERVIFYDYDEIVPIEECNFRKLPEPRTLDQEMASEPWYHVAENDVFPAEFKNYLMINDHLKKVFGQQYAHLMSEKYWCSVQEKIGAGVLLDVFPYDEHYRFCRQPEYADGNTTFDSNC